MDKLNLNVIVYCQFPTTIEQRNIDHIQNEIHDFVDFLGVDLIEEHWELISEGAKPQKLVGACNTCVKEGYALLTYNWKTLHQYKSAAKAVYTDLNEYGVPLFFVDEQSIMELFYI